MSRDESGAKAKWHFASMIRFIGENHLSNYWILNSTDFLTKPEQNFSNHETTTQKTDTRQKICKVENRYHKRC